MNILQVFREAYVLMTNEDVRRLAAQPWQAASVALWASRLLRGDGSIPLPFVCLGQALEPRANGAANQLTLAPGLALYHDSTEGDMWIGKIKPLLVKTEQAITITTNSDATGHDRVDVVAVRPKLVEGDIRSATFKTPGAAPGTGRFTRDSPHQTSWEVEHQVFEGVAAVTPVIPSLPSGWIKVCEVVRPNGQADVNASNVTDRRTGDTLRANHLSLSGGASSFVRFLLGGQAYSGQTYSSILRANETEGFWSQGDIIGANNTFDDSKPVGTWWIDVLKVWSQLWVEELRTRSATKLSLKNAAGTEFLPFVGKNQFHAFGTFIYSQANNRYELVNGWNLEATSTRASAGNHTVELLEKTMSGNNATVWSKKSNLGTTRNADEFSVTASGASPNVALNLRYYDDSTGNLADPPASPVQEFFVAVLDANATP